MIAFCLLCGKSVHTDAGILPYPADFCQCAAKWITSISTPAWPISSISFSTSSGTITLSTMPQKERVEVPQAFYEAFGDEELQP